MNLVNYLKEEKHLTDRKAIIEYLIKLNLIEEESDLIDQELLKLENNEVDLIYPQRIYFSNSDKYSRIKFTNKTQSNISFEFENSNLESLINLPDYMEDLILKNTNLINFNYSPRIITNRLRIWRSHRLQNLKGFPDQIGHVTFHSIDQNFSFLGCENTIVDLAELNCLSQFKQFDSFFKKVNLLQISECPNIKSYSFPRSCGLKVFKFDQPRKLSLKLLLIPELQTLEYIGFHGLHHIDEDTLHIFRFALASGESPGKRLLNAQNAIIDHERLDHILEN